MEGWREEGKVAGGSRIKLREKERARKIGRERESIGKVNEVGQER